LNIGAGGIAGTNGWTTMDICRQADYWWDASRPLPIRDGTVDRVYSSHMLEHLSYRQIIVFLKEAYRILKPGGEISIAVPDAAIYLDAYFKKEILPDNLLSYQPAIYSKLPIDMVNYMAYMGGEHRHLFTMDNLLDVLRKAGFRDVNPREFDPEKRSHIYKKLHKKISSDAPYTFLFLNRFINQINKFSHPKFLMANIQKNQLILYTKISLY